MTETTTIQVWRGRDTPKSITSHADDWDDVEWAVLFPLGWMRPGDPPPPWVLAMDISSDPDRYELPDGSVLFLAVQ